MAFRRCSTRARRGARVRVFEQAERLGEIDAGIQLGPNAVAVLEALSRRDDVAVQASSPPAIELRDHRNGRLVARVPLGPTTEARYGRPYWHLHRADLLAALTAGVVEAGAEIRLGSRVEAMTPDGRGLRIAGETVDLVVAADGLRSGQRAARFRSGAARYTGHVAWRGTVATDRLPAGLFPDAACVTMGPGRHLVTYPLRAGRLINFVAVERRAAWAPEDWSQSDDRAVLRRAFYGWNPAVTTLLAAVRTGQRESQTGLLRPGQSTRPQPAHQSGQLPRRGRACATFRARVNLVVGAAEILASILRTGARDRRGEILRCP